MQSSSDEGHQVQLKAMFLTPVGSVALTFAFLVVDALRTPLLANDVDSKMKFAAIIASMLATVSAFAPVSRVTHASSLKMADFSKEIGAQMPLGYWDPLGLLGRFFWDHCF